MPKYMIERDMPGVGQLADEDIFSASKKSNEVLASLAPRVQWQQSYVTGDKIYCVYLADTVDDVVEHARCAGLPANRISEVQRVIDPATGGA
jgi:hypothetical protein